jgi:hypothetical protein
MERKINLTQCDVCGRKAYDSYSYLRTDDWTKYKMFKDWQSGSHSGTHDLEIIVCPKCDGKKGIRHFFFKILKPFTSSHNSDSQKSLCLDCTARGSCYANKIVQNKILVCKEYESS